MEKFGEFTTDGGKTYTLCMRDGSLGYTWVGDGKLPKRLQGLFTDVISAITAKQTYLAEKELEASRPSRLSVLEECKSNKDLIEFCKNYNLLVPDTTNTKAMKKQIKEKLLAQGDKE